MSDEAVIAILIFLLIVVAFVCIRYDTEVRALFGRLERFKADRRGIESTFTPASPPAVPAAGTSAAPDIDEPVSGLDRAEHDVGDDGEVDIRDETSIDVVHRMMIVAAVAGDVDRAEKARLRIHEISNDEVEIARVDALLDALNFQKSGRHEDFKKLRDRVVDRRIAAYVERLTGMVLEDVKRPAEAADAYARAAAAATTPEFRAEMIAKRARMLGRARRADVAEAEVKDALRDESDPAARARLWRALAGTYAERERRLDQAIALQEAREHDSNDSDLCFQIAWALGQSERSDLRPLAVHFYRMAIHLDSENQFAQNNLGWEYSQADLPIEAARHYVRAADLGNTLGMANLAGLKLSAGLADEAEEILKAAQLKDDPHQNVAATLAELARERGGQSAKAERLDRGGEELAEFCSRVAKAELEDDRAGLPVFWRWDSGGDVGMSLEGGRAVFGWTDAKKQKLEVRFRGRSGRGTHYVMGTRYSYVDDETVEAGWEKAREVLLVFDENDRLAIAFIDENQPEFRTLEAGAHPDG